MFTTGKVVSAAAGLFGWGEEEQGEKGGGGVGGEAGRAIRKVGERKKERKK